MVDDDFGEKTGKIRYHYFKNWDFQKSFFNKWIFHRFLCTKFVFQIFFQKKKLYKTTYEIFTLGKNAFENLNFWNTLESVIDVGQGISVGPGKFDKKNKRRALNTHVLCSK